MGEYESSVTPTLLPGDSPLENQNHGWSLHICVTGIILAPGHVNFLN